MHSVLLVEDDESIRAALRSALTERQFSVVAVATAAEGLRETAAGPVDIVLLDLGLPDLDGAAALRMIRGISSVPVIVVTARRGETSIVQLLEAGADDYVVKPFSADHLVARMRALLRRTNTTAAAEEQRVVAAGGLHIDLLQRSASFHGQHLALTRREFDLLVYLAERPNRVVTRRELCDQVWAASEKASDQTIDVHLSWLRRKLGETAANPRYLHTVRGVGVKLVVTT
ncbi:response regulator transcription factor [Lentzea sp. NPDC051838]|uniref:response regulator transcription factor n=1 Tax=Lentzea sp. NPDC051838 TaxID=3154849 RepID=UPI0034288B81